MKLRKMLASLLGARRPGVLVRPKLSGTFGVSGAAFQQR